MFGDDSRMLHLFCFIYFTLFQGLPLWLGWQRIQLQFRRPRFDPWVGKISWRRKMLPTLVFWPGEFHGLYSPWGCKELDMNEQLSLSLSYFYCYYISSTSDCQALDLGGWGPLVIEGSIQGQMTNISTQESEQVVDNTIQ